VIIRELPFTWTPKKGRVAEPGFSGQPPGSGVIWQENHHPLLLAGIHKDLRNKTQNDNWPWNILLFVLKAF
jgi:hypothetical protein